MDAGEVGKFLSMWGKKKKKKKERFSHLSLSWLASLGRLLQRQIRCR